MDDMGVGYMLVNYTKKEMIRFSHIPASKARELAGNPVSAAMVTWYMLENCGDNIAFVSDTYDDWPFPGDDKQLSDYLEITNQVVDSLINAEILVDEGIEWADEDEPDTIYMRALRNRWMDK
jgi:pyridoxine/pyridoxamine 5'-phosphate oxidase